MKRGARFSEKVIAFSLTERSRGKRWKDIQNAIQQEFQIEPPTERQMRNWYREYGGGSINQEKLLRETLVKLVRDSTPLAALVTQQLALEKGIPTLLTALEQQENPRVAVGLLLLTMLEENFGKEFDDILRRYQEGRERRRQ